MEYFWYIVAAAGAGIGTGLAGLSAATVMVPILIVLCPSFGGYYGAYQATAIALASDILGSAVTSYTYAKNKNIDLKHGWVMMACIIALSSVGSYVAYIVGNVVLGGFTLFLTFCIGIRFIIKPDTSKKGASASNVRLGLKEIIISIFFGLTIGFGTGFVGTGGGMMMLVVFTAFLGYDLKSAVGTSTFIMTFTALIGFVAHSMINPAIILERWNVLILCIIVATTASLISARFANRVDNKTVGLTTGIILTILGACMIYLNYFVDMQVPVMVSEILYTLGILIVFLIVAVAFALLLFKIFHIGGEVRRKILHTISFLIILVIMITSTHWYVPAIICIVFTVVVYPILCFFENHPLYKDLFQQRNNGEVKKSLILLFGNATVLISLFWGILGSEITVIASILAWGLGDEAAALIGKSYGKHHIPINDHKKTYEGSIAMCIVAFIAIVITLYVGHVSLLKSVLVALVGSIGATIIEAISIKGYDTVTVSFMTSIIIFIMLQ
ncbi:MAG: TSUP family transporter [Erysipelotrichaceae bacterium]|nr:TSUP family transporter [Erysipelotrichaceae bacterium]